MTIHIERDRTAVLVRNDAGLYRLMYFQPMGRDAALALLPQYGYAAMQAVSVDTLTQRTSLRLRDGIILPKLLQAYDHDPFVVSDDSHLARRQTREWLETLLQRMLPRNTRLCPLSNKTVKEIYTLINLSHYIV